jgi:hypothetical protein
VSLHQPPDPRDQDRRLAELLDACLHAEQGTPGSAAELVRNAPEELRDELGELLGLARTLQTTPWPAPSPQLRARVRARLQPARAAPAAAPSVRRRLAPWLLRAAAGVAALALASYGGVLASADALPGQPLYAVKQADEFVTLGLARDDMSRALVLLHQAGARLSEATRLLQARQIQPAGELLQQYAATLERAQTTLSRVTAPDQQARAEFQSVLRQQLGELDTLAGSAPPALQPNIQRAQAAVTQQLAVEQSQSGATQPPTAAGPSPSTGAASVTATAAASATAAVSATATANATATVSATPPASNPSSAASPVPGTPTRLPAAPPSPAASPPTEPPQGK